MENLQTASEKVREEPFSSVRSGARFSVVLDVLPAQSGNRNTQKDIQTGKEV